MTFVATEPAPTRTDRIEVPSPQQLGIRLAELPSTEPAQEVPAIIVPEPKKLGIVVE
jgi:hypothetical protein